MLSCIVSTLVETEAVNMDILLQVTVDVGQESWSCIQIGLFLLSPVDYLACCTCIHLWAFRSGRVRLLCSSIIASCMHGVLLPKANVYTYSNNAFIGPGNQCLHVEVGNVLTYRWDAGGDVLTSLNGRKEVGHLHLKAALYWVTSGYFLLVHLVADQMNW